MSSFPCRAKILRIERLEDRQLLSAGSPDDPWAVIRNPTPDVGDRFGASVASVGDEILVGAPRDDTYGRGAGIAYLFDRDGNLRLTFPDPADLTLATSDTFGTSVAAVGQNVLIGAPLADWGALDAGAAYLLNAGAAYLFDGESGRLLQTFHNPEPGESDHFGSTVLAVGNDILIGAPRDSQDAANAGSAYLFGFDTEAEEYVLRQKLTAPNPPAGGRFGDAVAALDDDHILIASAPEETVYVFERNASSGVWDLERTIQKPEPDVPGRFGSSIAVAGDQVLVGVAFDDTYGRDAGMAYQFDASGEEWTPRPIPDPLNPTHPTLNAGDHFGTSVAAVGDNFVIGADQLYSGDGGVYWLGAASGNELVAIENPEPGDWDAFGNQVAALGDDFIVGAPFDDAGATDAGSVYVFPGMGSGGDTPPTISPIADQNVNEDTSTGPVNFTVGDEESEPGSLVVTATSSDPTRIPDANLVLGGSGALRMIEVLPAADRNGGPVTITVAVSDGTNTTIETFEVNIAAVNDAPSFAIGADQSVPEDAGPQSVAGFAAEISAGPADESGQGLAFQIESDKPGLFAVQPAIDPATGQLTYTPAPDANGVAVVMVQLMDDGGTANGGVDKSPMWSFRIEILSEQQQIENIFGQIDDLGDSGVLNRGQAKSLSRKLDRVLDKLDRDKLKAAVNQLRAFVHQVESFVEEDILSPEEGQTLIAAATDVLDSILIED